MNKIPTLEAEFRPRIAEVLKALGHPLRLHIVEILARGEASVGAVQEELEASQSAVSQQMTVLRSAGVVNVRKDANKRFYSLANPNLISLLNCLEKCQQKCTD